MTLRGVHRYLPVIKCGVQESHTLNIVLPEVAPQIIMLSHPYSCEFSLILPSIIVVIELVICVSSPVTKELGNVSKLRVGETE